MKNILVVARYKENVDWIPNIKFDEAFVFNHGV